MLFSEEHGRADVLRAATTMISSGMWDEALLFV